MLLFLLEVLLGVPIRTTRIPPDSITFKGTEDWVFENVILADDPFAKALRIFKTCVSVNNNLCRKLVASLEPPIKFDKGFKVTSVPFFIAILAY